MKRLLLIAMVALLPGSLLRAVFSDPPPVPWETNLSNWVCANDHGAKFGDNRDDTAAIQAAVDAAAAAGKTVVYPRGIGGGDPNWYNLNGEVRVRGSVRMIIGLGFGRVIGGDKGRFIVDDRSAPVVKFLHLQAFDIVDAEFSAAGVREISFGNTYPVKARERRREETRTEEGVRRWR